jgi:hypothetical protein
MAFVASLAIARLRVLLRQSLGYWEACARGAAALVVVWAASLVTAVATAPKGAAALGVPAIVALTLLAAKWASIVAVVPTLRLAAAWDPWLVLALGWAVPRCAPALTALDASSPLADLALGTQTFRGCLADTGAIFALGLAAIVLDRKPATRP